MTTKQLKGQPNRKGSILHILQYGIYKLAHWILFISHPIEHEFDPPLLSYILCVFALDI